MDFPPIRHGEFAGRSFQRNGQATKLTPGKPNWSTYTDRDIIADNIASVQRVLEHFQIWPDVEKQRAIEARFRDLSEVAVVLHCTRPERLLDIVHQGRFVSWLEQGRISSEYEQMRRRVETVLFGERARSPEIVYGVLTDAPNLSAASAYGGVRLCLRREIRSRCTITRTDSLSVARDNRYSPAWSLLAAVPLEEPNAILLPRRTVSDLNAAGGISDLHTSTDYFEVQIHGGVTLSDIASVELRSGTILAKEVERWLIDNQISIQKP